MRTRLAAVLVLVSIAVAACSGGSTTPTVTLRSRGGVSDPSYVVREMAAKCSPGIARVQVDLTQGDVHLRHAFACTLLRHAANAKDVLIGLVAGRHNAVKGADLTLKLQDELRLHVYARSNLVWAIGTGFGCDRLTDIEWQRSAIAASAHLNPPDDRETPTQWIEVEGARYAGSCPDELATFLDSVARAGYSTAVRAAGTELKRLGITITPDPSYA